MTAITFPTDPTEGQEYVANNGVTYNWLGNRWAQSTHNRVKYVNVGGDAAHVYSTATDFTIGGGSADEGGPVVNITTATLFSGVCYPNYGEITLTITRPYTEAGIVIHGISVSYDQTVVIDPSEDVETTIYIPVLDTQLQQQTASVEVYVLDSRGYITHVPIADTWIVPYTT